VGFKLILLSHEVFDAIPSNLKGSEAENSRRDSHIPHLWLCCSISLLGHFPRRRRFLAGVVFVNAALPTSVAMLGFIKQRPSPHVCESTLVSAVDQNVWL